MDIDYNELFGLDGADGEVSDENTDADVEESGEGGTEVSEQSTDVSDDGNATADDAATDADSDIMNRDVGEGDEADVQEDKAAESESPRGGRSRTSEDSAEAQLKAELEAERLRHKGEMDALVKSLGLKDANGKPIESREALDTYNRTQRADEARSRLRRAGVDVEALEELVSENPEVKAARAVVAEAEREKARAAEVRQRAAFDEEIRKVGEIDPTVKSVEDLRAKPYFGDVYRMVERGYSISDAVRLATYDENIRRVAEGSAKSAAAKAASKAHLVPTSSRGQGALTVPAAIMNQYRLFCPDATDAEIQKMFNDDQKRMRK